MAISSVVTLGYSVGGGFQAGNTTLATIGFDSAEVATAGFVCILSASLSVPDASADISVENATGTIVC